MKTTIENQALKTLNILSILFCLNFSVSASASNNCPASPSAAGQTSGTFNCTCGPVSISQSIWGSSPYTYDSSLCSAAVHAGKISAQGGDISYTMKGAQNSFTGTTANGVQTSSWPSYPMSFAFNTIAPTPAPVVAPAPVATVSNSNQMCLVHVALKDGAVFDAVKCNVTATQCNDFGIQRIKFLIEAGNIVSRAVSIVMNDELGTLPPNSAAVCSQIANGTPTLDIVAHLRSRGYNL